MKCRICKVKIQGKQYVGLGKYANVCVNHAKELIKNNHDKMNEIYLDAHTFEKVLSR